MLSILPHCKGPSVAEGPVQFDPAAVPYPRLSDYRFFTGPADQFLPNEGVIYYELITPLFTDYAHKSRFIWMPDSVAASIDQTGTVRFPDNSVLIKHFYYPADFRRPDRNRDLVETRLLVKRAGKWEAFTYVWDKDDADADLNIVGDIREVSWKDEKRQFRKIDYVVPNKNQCKSCHNTAGTLQPIGPKVRNLYTEVEYPDGNLAPQLAYWRSQGLLSASDAEQSSIDPIADWSHADKYSLEDRALAYLDVNCGHCHNPEGPAHTSGLVLEVDVEDGSLLGVCKTPVAAGKGSGGRRFSIVPGKPDSSILLFRMQSEDPGIMMPELGRVMPHQEGIELIRDWIAGMEGDCN